MIEIQEYNPDWAEQFEEIKSILTRGLAGHCIGIEHVGSTSIVGQVSKPILDIDIIIESRHQLPAIIVELAKLGYTYRGDLDVEGREAFGQIDEHVPWNTDRQQWIKQHLYVCAQDNPELYRHLNFRNYLREHPDEVESYGKLKRMIIQQTEDREQYTMLKTDFVEGILRKASHSGL